MRKKQAQHLDARYVTMVENAYYYCNPPPIEKTVKKKRPPLQEYIRKLLYKDLSKVTTEKVLRQMRKLPWQDPEIKSYLICCMVNIWNVKYNSIHCVANLLAGLVAYQEDVGIHVVDGVLEDIRLGMEVRGETCMFKNISRHVVSSESFKDMIQKQNLMLILDISLQPFVSNTAACRLIGPTIYTTFRCTFLVFEINAE